MEGESGAEASQAPAPTSNAEEAEVERFYEDLQDLLELTPPKDVLFMIGDWNANRQHIKKQRHDFVNKGPSSQSYGFSSSHVWK